MGVFLQVNKDYMGLGLKSVDLLIISQVEEFTRNGNQCYVTNKQFSDMFGESESTIKRAIDKLVKANIIHRDTVFVQGNGRANKQRVLNIKSRKKWKVQNEPTIKECKVQNDLTKEMEGSNFEMEGSKSDDGRFKNDQWKGHNDPIKYNKNINKIKIKDNFNSNSDFDLKDNFGCKVQNDPSNKIKDNTDDIPIEKKKELINLYEPGCKVYKIANTVGLDYDIAKQIIDEYTKNPKDYFYVPPVIKSFIVYDEYNNKSTMDRETIAMSLLDLGEDKKKINKCLNSCYDDIIKCKENNEEEVREFFKKEFKFIKDESVIKTNLHNNDYEIDDEKVFG